MGKHPYLHIHSSPSIHTLTLTHTPFTFSHAHTLSLRLNLLTLLKHVCAAMCCPLWAWTRARIIAVDMWSSCRAGVEHMTHFTCLSGQDSTRTRVTSSRYLIEGDTGCRGCASSPMRSSAPTTTRPGWLWKAFNSYSGAALQSRIFSSLSISISERTWQDSLPSYGLVFMVTCLATLASFGRYSWAWVGWAMSKASKLSTLTRQSSNWSHSKSTRASNSSSSPVLYNGNHYQNADLHKLD